MIVAIVALRDIVIDPDKQIDLDSMPIDEATKLVKESYGFLSDTVDVSIENGIATVVLEEEEGQEKEEALKWYRNAVKNAEHGDYKRSITLFKRVLERIPNHLDARRNLAMSYLESGDKESAKNHIIEVLKLNPKDTWSYVLLGNMAAKNENDLARAEKWYERAYQIAPNDSILLTNYGALLIQKGNREQAEEHFERAIQANPKYPNSYYALALLQMQNGNPEDGLRTLDGLFERGEPSDVRSAPLYEEARRLCLELNKQLASKNEEQMKESVETKRKQLEEATGFPIEIREDNSLQTVFAVTQLAWKHSRDHHVIRYCDMTAPVNPHNLMHELEHISLEHQARKLGRNRFFASGARNREFAINLIKDDIAKLERMGYPEKKLTATILEMVEGMTSQLYNAPLDMVIENRLLRDSIATRHSQFVALFATQAKNLTVFTNKETKRLVPTIIFRSSTALNCSYAIFIDHLYKGRTDYARAYRGSDIYSTGQKLFDASQDVMAHFDYGDEYALVDEFAGILKMRDWYEWKNDSGTSADSVHAAVPTLKEGAPQGTTNPELLKEKEPASVMYLLGALERFDKMKLDKIRDVGFEIGVIGMEGIDYASSESKYSLRSIPNEKFTGLQLLCLMYAAFQQIDPSLNVGADLKSAYQMALQLHRGKAN